MELPDIVQVKEKVYIESKEWMELWAAGTVWGVQEDKLKNCGKISQ